jgi:acyl transferase domain-containing protein
MEERAGFLADSLQQLAAQLQAYLAGENAGVYQAKAGRDKGLHDLLERWVSGRDPDWNRLYADVRPQRIGLPGYPFAKERYWIDANQDVPGESLGLNAGPPAASREDDPGDAPQTGPSLLREKTLQRTKQLFGRVLKLQPERVDEHQELSGYGVDSLMITHLNDQLAKVFGALPRTLFFEYRSLAEVTNYFLERHENECRSWTGLDQQSVVPPENDSRIASAHSGPAPRRAGPRAAIPAENGRQPIAIIGLSGIYPQADTLEQYWENLRGGRDCITEIPRKRWPLEGFFDSDRMRAVERGRSYCKWGGFIDQFDQFDPFFFGIAPSEASSMDPQERIFLQAVWHALESAGYTRRDLREKFRRQVGVFAGITKLGFNLHGSEASRRDEKFYPHTSFSSLANRVSYFLDITGPSMPIDTMCSSSLTAIHEACEHIHRGECALALAGGVNLYLHPSTYVDMAAQYALSRDGKCRSFGAGASGFVPGEGVGAVLLKPLAAALADDDNIHGLILATHVNHGGKTNGYTVPNPRAQAELIGGAIAKAGISAREISYIEAHGTGTELGDPIEMEGLRQAFGQCSPDSGYCRVGSAKSNIGHLEAAAGMAGLTKVLLQMKHREIAPSLHATEVNPGIRFDGTPFVLNTELMPWEPTGPDGRVLPRVAGISSFGAGGANAHIIVKEFMRTVPPRWSRSATPDPRVVVPLSAKTPEQLRQVAGALLEFLLAAPQDDLAAVAYTLQVGREALDERVAFVVESIDQLEDELRAYVAREQGAGETYRGRIASAGKDMSVINQDDDMQQAVSRWLARKKLGKLAEFWVGGLSFDWNELYGESKPSRLDLPVYPFSGERYWIDAAAASHDAVAAPRGAWGSKSLEEILGKLEGDALEPDEAADMLRVLM